MQVSAPPRRLTGDGPAEFLETRVNIPEGIIYTQEIDTFLPEPQVEQELEKIQALWSATAEDRLKLFKAMTIFHEKLIKKEPSYSQVDLRKCQWPDVMAEFDRAINYYQVERQKGPVGFIYTYLRKIGENSKVFESWLTLLPDGDYGAGICGAFKLILGAAGRMHTVRASIYEALKDIPEAIGKARRYMKIYCDVKAYRLSQKTAELFSAVLNALERIIVLLTEHGFKRAGKAFFLGEAYSQPLLDAIENVKKCALEINEEAQVCEQERMQKMDRQIFSGFDATSSTLGALKKEVEQMKERQIVVTEAFHQFLLAQPTLDPRSRQPYSGYIEQPQKSKTRRKKVKKTIEPQAPAFTTNQLLRILSYDHKIPAMDVETCRLEGQAMTAEAKDRISHVSRSDQLASWILATQESAPLLILGKTQDPTELMSPLSYLAAELSHAYRETESTTTISHFCGLHTESWKDPRANSVGIIVSLLHQLLSNEKFRSEFDLGFVGSELSERLLDDDIEALCHVFKTLVLQIKKIMVLFCFIDGVSIYDTTDKKDDTVIVLNMLLELIETIKDNQENGSEGVVFKLLFTEPGASCIAESLLEEEEIYRVDEFMDGDGQEVIVMQQYE